MEAKRNRMFKKSIPVTGSNSWRRSKRRTSERLAKKSLSRFKNTARSPIEIDMDENTDFENVQDLNAPIINLLSSEGPSVRSKAQGTVGGKNSRIISIQSSDGSTVRRNVKRSCVKGKMVFNNSEEKKEKDGLKGTIMMEGSYSGRKRTRDTLEVKKKLSRTQKGKSKDSNCQKYLSIINRCSPKPLSKAITLLNKVQRNEVEKMGFGKLLSMKIDGIPRKLGYYVVDVFNEEKMAIELPCGDIKVDEDAVHLMLGVPKEGILLDSLEEDDIKSSEIDDWRSSYGDSYISPADIVGRITSSGGTNINYFKLDFLALFLSTMVECHAHGKCKLSAIYRINNRVDVSKINWCAYIVSKLKTSKMMWERNNTKPFTGPLTVLTLLYVRGMSCKGMEEDYSKPAIQTWNIEKLKLREKMEIKNGGFGNGDLLGISADCWGKVNERRAAGDVNPSLVGLPKGELCRLEEIMSKTVTFKKELELGILEMQKKNSEIDGIKRLIYQFESVFNQKPKSLCSPMKGGISEEKEKNENNPGLDELIYKVCLEVNERRQAWIESEEDDVMNDEDKKKNDEHESPKDVHFPNNTNLEVLHNDDNCSMEYGATGNKCAGNSRGDKTGKISVGDNATKITDEVSLGGEKFVRKSENTKSIGRKEQDADRLGFKVEQSEVLNKEHGPKITKGYTKSQIIKNRFKFGEELASRTGITVTKDVIDGGMVEERKKIDKGLESKGSRDEEPDVNPKNILAQFAQKLEEKRIKVPELNSYKLELKQMDGKFGTNKVYQSSNLGGPSFSLGLTQEENTVAEKRVYQSCNMGGPSFSLGLTQEEKSADEKRVIQSRNLDSPSQRMLFTPKEKSAAEEKVDNPAKSIEPSFSLGLTQDESTPHEVNKSKNMESPTHSMRFTHKEKSEADEKEDLKTEKKPIRKNPRRKRMVSSSVKSPYLKRETTIHQLFSKEDEAIWELIFNANPSQQVFDTHIGVRSEIFILRTLEPGREVYGNIIDCWAAVLNNEEKLRSKESPHRLFVCHQPFLEWLFINEEKCLRTFTNNIFEALGREESQRDLKGYDVVFFPILEKKHFYLVVFDLKNPASFVIDNMDAEESIVQMVDHDDYQKKDTPYKVKHIFNQYLLKWGNGKAGRMASTNINKLELSWATKGNYTDCGIFTMRHMEMFKGNNGAGFDCGFKSNEKTLKSQIKILRKKYASRILLSDINVHKKKVMDEAYSNKG